MAGLPKSGAWAVLAALLAVVFCVVASAQTVPPPLLDEQTSSDTLQPLVDAIGLNAFATTEQTQSLVAAFSGAVAAQHVTIDQALAMLALVSWSTLADAESTTQALDAILTVLQGLAAGTITGDPLVALADLLAGLVTPAGVRNAIARAGGSEALLEQVDDLVAAGVPPGILVRLTKQSSHDGIDEARVSLLLDELAATATGDRWGQVVNAVLDVGTNQYRDREANANANKNTDGNEEEEEENQHGNGSGGKDKKG